MFREEEDLGMQVDIILDKEWVVLWGCGLPVSTYLKEES